MRVFGEDGSVYGYSNVVSTITVPWAPNGLSWSDVGISSVTIAWTDTSENPDDSVYRVELSTGSGFTGTILSSTTVKAAGGAYFGSLLPNTTYYGRVTARSWSGAETSSAMGSRVTYAAAPSVLSLAAVNVSSVSLSWNANSNPSWTRYEVTCSTDDFVSGVSTPIALGDGHTAVTGVVSGLAADTTFWFRVRAFNSDGASAAYADTVSSITLSFTPSLSGMEISSDTLRIAWGANGNPSWTRYVAENIVAGSSISAQAVLAWRETGLAPNTTYQYRVKAVNGSGISSGWAVFWSTSTLAVAPPAPEFAGVAVSSVNYRINVDVNPGWTEYGVGISSDGNNWRRYARPDGTFGETPVYASTTSWGASPWVRGLTANTIYRLCTFARNNNGVETNYCTAGTTLTVPSTPSGLVPAAVNTTSIVVSWNANGNPGWTRYELSYSTDNFTGDVRTAFTWADGHTATIGLAGGLTANTTYQLRVRVFGEDGSVHGYSNIVSTVTTLWAPNGLAWSDVGISSIAVAWTDTTSNPDDSVYRYELSTVADFSGAVLSSATIKTAGAAVISGLVPNTTYYGRVTARSKDGRETSAPLVPSGTATQCTDPADISIAAVYQSSVTMNWNARGNPAWTRYEISCSTDNFIVHQAVAGAFSDSIILTTFTAQNLASNTTWYFRVRATNSGGFTTAFTAVVSTVTAPARPGGLAWGTAYPDGLTMTWPEIGGNSADTVYRYELSENSSFSGAVLSSTTVKGAASALITGLAVNTTYYGRVIAQARDGRETAAGAASPAGMMTLALPPGNSSITGVFVSSVSLSWGANGNPGWTRYEITCSTDAFAAHVSTAAGIADGYTGTSFTASDLVPNTTYYFRVRAANGSSVPAAYANVVSSVTLPLAPNGLSWGAVSAHTIAALWADTTGNPADSLYRYEISATADFSGTILSSMTVKSAGTAVVGGLTANTTYFGRVVAVSRNDIRAASPLAPACVETLSETPASFDFTSIHFTSATVSWLANGNPPGTRYEISYSTDSFTQYFSTPVALADGLTSVSADLAGLLPGTTYWFRVRAFSSTGQASAFSNSINTETRENYVSMSLNGTPATDRAVDDNFIPSDGYENFVSAVDTATVRVDGDGDGKYDFLVSTAGSLLPEVYWDPDAHYFTHVSIGDVDDDGVPDYIFDTDGNGYPDTYYNVTLSSVMAYYPFAARDVNGDGSDDYAYDDNVNVTDGFESYRSLVTTAAARVDGDFDGRYDFLISTAGTADPEVYWDPDEDVFGTVERIDMNNDGLPDWVFDADGDGMPESYYDAFASSVTRGVPLAGTGMGIPGTFIAADGNTASGYDVYVDPSGQSVSVMDLDCDGDGKYDFFIDISHDGIPDRYADPDNGFATVVTLRDYDGDGTADWGIDTAGTGAPDKYYRMPGGPLLAAFRITREKAYTISPNPFYSDRETAVIVYDMTEAGEVIIDIYDIAGEKVAVLVNGYRSDGRHQVRWNGGNGEFDAADGSTAGSGDKLAKGVYIMRFKLPAEQYLKKIAIIR